jgi:hypothetical protein
MLTGVPSINGVPVVASPSGPYAGANTPEDIAKAAVKFDSGKLRWDLLPFDAVEALVALYTIGAQKYADNNWLKGFHWMRTVAALLRHLTLWILAPMRGEDGLDHDNDKYCKELGLPTPSHLDGVIWNAVALRTFELRGLGTDNRPGK